MNVIGKIFVFGVFVMSLVLMTFAGVVYMSHVNWRDEVEREPGKCLPNQKPGYKYQIEQAEAERAKLEQTIADLQRKVAESEQSRDQVLGKLQSALIAKSEQVQKLEEEKKAREKAQQDALDELKESRERLQAAAEDVKKLEEQIREQRVKVDGHVDRAAELSAELAEAKAQLAIAEERKSQLEKQVANARLLLKQNGLSIDSLPRDRVPQLDGDVIAVASGQIQVSIGSDDGLQVGHTLHVYRGGDYIGRAVVKTVNPDRAVAELIKDFSRGIVQRGDRVTTRLKA